MDVILLGDELQMVHGISTSSKCCGSGDHDSCRVENKIVIQPLACCDGLLTLMRDWRVELLEQTLPGTDCISWRPPPLRITRSVDSAFARNNKFTPHVRPSHNTEHNKQLPLTSERANAIDRSPPAQFEKFGAQTTQTHRRPTAFRTRPFHPRRCLFPVFFDAGCTWWGTLLGLGPTSRRCQGAASMLSC